ncbi:ABC transporter permease protein [Bacteroides pyogenes JCM 10003]|nr:ABC transporter permease protein [Bacteroides pyogenes JCM 10003]
MPYVFWHAFCFIESGCLCPKKMRQTMKQIYYVIQTLLRGRGSNVIKTVSLTLGLFVGILLFARVAFELSYYNFLRRPAELYVAYLSGFEEMSEGKGAPYTFGPFSAAVRENFPEEVEDARY